MSKYPKLWGRSSAVGEAKVRQLQKIGTPWLRASGPGFVAEKQSKLSNVKTGENPDVLRGFLVVPHAEASGVSWGPPVTEDNAPLGTAGAQPDKALIYNSKAGFAGKRFVPLRAGPHTWVGNIVYAGERVIVSFDHGGVGRYRFSGHFQPIQADETPANPTAGVAGTADLYILGCQISTGGRRVLGAALCRTEDGEFIRVVSPIGSARTSVEILSAPSPVKRFFKKGVKRTYKPEWTSLGVYTLPDASKGLFRDPWYFSADGMLCSSVIRTAEGVHDIRYSNVISAGAFAPLGALDWYAVRNQKVFVVTLDLSEGLVGTIESSEHSEIRVEQTGGFLSGAIYDGGTETIIQGLPIFVVLKTTGGTGGVGYAGYEVETDMAAAFAAANDWCLALPQITSFTPVGPPLYIASSEARPGGVFVGSRSAQVIWNAPYVRQVRPAGGGDGLKVRLVGKELIALDYTPDGPLPVYLEGAGEVSLIGDAGTGFDEYDMQNLLFVNTSGPTWSELIDVRAEHLALQPWPDYVKALPVTHPDTGNEILSATVSNPAVAQSLSGGLRCSVQLGAEELAELQLVEYDLAGVEGGSVRMGVIYRYGPEYTITGVDTTPYSFSGTKAEASEVGVVEAAGFPAAVITRRSLKTGPVTAPVTPAGQNPDVWPGIRRSAYTLRRSDDSYTGLGVEATQEGNASTVPGVYEVFALFTDVFPLIRTAGDAVWSFKLRGDTAANDVLKTLPPPLTKNEAGTYEPSGNASALGELRPIGGSVRQVLVVPETDVKATLPQFSGVEDLSLRPIRSV